jgi:DNA-binding NtrC family response regulator
MMQHRRRVLIVEDEILIRFFLHELLLDNDWDVLEASTAEEGLSILDNATVDAIMSDLEMPGELDGLDLCWHVHQRTPGIPKILMSGRRLPLKESLPPNTRFFAKPVLADQLMEALSEMLS